MDRKSHTSQEFRRYLAGKSWLIAISILALGIGVAGFISTLPRPNAAYAVPASTPTLKVSPDVQPYFSNTKLRVQGSNYPSSAETVNVYWGYQNAGNPGTLEGHSTTSNGAFSFSFLLPLSGSAATQLSISAYGFQNKENVSVYWSNDSQPILSVQTNASGYVQPWVFTVPANTPPGNYTVNMVGANSGLSITNTFTVVAPSSKLSITSGPVGSRVRVSGQGYTPNETINIIWNYNGVGAKNVVTTTADRSGSFHVSFLIPTNTNGIYTNNGNYVVAAVGATSKSATQNTFTVAPGLSASPLTFAPSQSTNLAGSGFQANETVNFYWDSTSGRLLSTVTADGHGNVAQAITISAKATPGFHTIIAGGQISHTTYNTAVTVDTPWNDFGFSAAHLRQNASENVVNTGNVASLQLKWNKSIGSPQPEGAPSPIYYEGEARHGDSE